MEDIPKTYEDGLREGRIKSLEESVIKLTADIGRLKPAMYGLYGAIALVQFLPALRGTIGG